MKMALSSEEAILPVTDPVVVSDIAPADTNVPCEETNSESIQELMEEEDEDEEEDMGESPQLGNLLECELEEGLPSSEWPDEFHSVEKEEDDASLQDPSETVPTGIPLVHKPVIHVLADGDQTPTFESLLKIKISPVLTFRPSRSFTCYSCCHEERQKGEPLNSGSDLMGVLIQGGYLSFSAKWLSEKKLVARAPCCTDSTHVGRTLIKDVRNKDGYAWMCLASMCGAIQEFTRPGFFASYEFHELSSLLAVTFHWAFVSDLSDIKKDCSMTDGQLFDLWLEFKRVCTDALEKSPRLGRIVYPPVFQETNPFIVEVAIFKFGPYLIAAALDRLMHVTRLKALPVSECSDPGKLVQLVDSVITARVTVVTDCSLLEGLRDTCELVYADPSITDPKSPKYHNLNVKNYVRRHIFHMFGNYSASQIEFEVLQLYLNELQWRERYGHTAEYAFWNIVYNIAGQEMGRLSKFQPEYEPKILAVCDNTGKHPLAPCEEQLLEFDSVKMDMNQDVTEIIVTKPVDQPPKCVRPVQEPAAVYPAKLEKVETVLPDKVIEVEEEVVLPDKCELPAILQSTCSSEPTKSSVTGANALPEKLLENGLEAEERVEQSLTHRVRKTDVAGILVDGEEKIVPDNDQLKGGIDSLNKLVSNLDRVSSTCKTSSETVQMKTSDWENTVRKPSILLSRNREIRPNIEALKTPVSDNPVFCTPVLKPSVETKPVSVSCNGPKIITEDVKGTQTSKENEVKSTSFAATNSSQVFVLKNTQRSGGNISFCAISVRPSVPSCVPVTPCPTVTGVPIAHGTVMTSSIVLPSPVAAASYSVSPHLPAASYPPLQPKITVCGSSQPAVTVGSRAGEPCSTAITPAAVASNYSASYNIMITSSYPVSPFPVITSNSASSCPTVVSVNSSVAPTKSPASNSSADFSKSKSASKSVSKSELDISSSVVYMVEGYTTLTITNLLSIRTWPAFLVYKNAPCLAELGRSLCIADFRKSLERQEFFAKPLQWLVTQDLVPGPPSCTLCGEEKMVLVSGNAKIHADKFCWQCTNAVCDNKQPFIRPKFFSRFGFSIQDILTLIYHWVVQSRMEDVHREVSLNEYKIRYVYWAIQKLCTKKMQQESVKLGNNGHVVEVAIVQLGQYCILGALDRQTMLTRLKAMPAPIVYKSSVFEAELEQWLEPWTCVITSYPNFGIKKEGLVHVCADPKSNMNVGTVSNYVVQLLSGMFGKYSSAGVKLEIIQGFLDEVQWRERYGPTPEAAFWSIFSLFAEEDEIDILKTRHILRKPGILFLNVPLWKMNVANSSEEKLPTSYGLKLVSTSVPAGKDSVVSCSDTCSTDAEVTVLREVHADISGGSTVPQNSHSSHVNDNQAASSQDSDADDVVVISLEEEKQKNDNDVICIEETSKESSPPSAVDLMDEQSSIEYATEEASEGDEVTSADSNSCSDSRLPELSRANETDSPHTVTAISSSVIVEESIDVVETAEAAEECVLLDELAGEQDAREKLNQLRKKLEEDVWDNHALTFESSNTKLLKPVIKDCMSFLKSPRKRKRECSSEKEGRSKNVSLDEYYYARMKPVDYPQAEKRDYVFNCSLCKEYFYSNVSVMAHTFEHAKEHRKKLLGGLRHCCGYCLMEFKMEDTLAYHIEQVHVKRNSYTCLICCQIFRSATQLNKHMLSHHVPSEMPYSCAACRFRSSVREEITEHFNVAHSTEPHLVCPYCLKMCSPRAKTDQVLYTQTYCQHLLQHQVASKMSKCPSCCLVFLNLNEVNSHMFKDHISFYNKQGVYPFKPRLNPVVLAVAGCSSSSSAPHHSPLTPLHLKSLPTSQSTSSKTMPKTSSVSHSSVSESQRQRPVPRRPILPSSALPADKENDSTSRSSSAPATETEKRCTSTLAQLLLKPEDQPVQSSAKRPRVSSCSSADAVTSSSPTSLPTVSNTDPAVQTFVSELAVSSYSPVITHVSTGGQQDLEHGGIDLTTVLNSGVEGAQSHLRADHSGAAQPCHLSMSVPSEWSIDRVVTKAAFPYVNINIDKPLICIECGTDIDNAHFLNTLSCHCKYSTNCVKSFVNHMVRVHSILLEQPGSYLRLNKISLEKDGKCDCGFSAKSGNKLASHMKHCVGRLHISQSLLQPKPEPVSPTKSDVNQENQLSIHQSQLSSSPPSLPPMENPNAGAVVAVPPSPVVVSVTSSYGGGQNNMPNMNAVSPSPPPWCSRNEYCSAPVQPPQSPYVMWNGSGGYFVRAPQILLQGYVLPNPPSAFFPNCGSMQMPPGCTGSEIVPVNSNLIPMYPNSSQQVFIPGPQGASTNSMQACSIACPAMHQGQGPAGGSDHDSPVLTGPPFAIGDRVMTSDSTSIIVNSRPWTISSPCKSVGNIKFEN